MDQIKVFWAIHTFRSLGRDDLADEIEHTDREQTLEMAVIAAGIMARAQETRQRAGAAGLAGPGLLRRFIGWVRRIIK